MNMENHTITSSELSAARANFRHLIVFDAKNGSRKEIFVNGHGVYLVFDGDKMVYYGSESVRASEAYNKITL